MKKENNNTNIKNQEEKVMNKMNENMDADVKIELEECKRYAICRIEAWYNSCHRYIEELSARVEREEGANGGALTQMLEECYAFVNHNGHYGDNDEYTIRDIIVDYLKKCPLIWFRPYIEEADLSYDYDLFDMMTSAYHESTVENDNNEENSTTEEEKEMKKEMIIDMVESTYEIVGKARTISNCTGIDESKEEEFLDREDRAVMAAEYIFGHSETEESENEKLLVDYYKNQPEEFFESWTDNDIAGEGLVERMAKDLLSAKANAPEFDKSDRMKLNIQDMYGVKLYRAEFLHTYRKLDARDDVMEDYLTNFLTSYMTWHSLMIQTNGWGLLMRKFYGFDGVYEPMLDCEPIFADGTEGEQHVYSWADYVSDVTAWLYDMMKIALVCGTYAPNGKYKTVTYEGYEDWYMDTLDIRLGAEEKVHAYDEERDFRLYKIEPEKVDFDTISDFMIKFKYEEPKPVKEITRDELRELDDDELDEYFYSRRAYNEGIGKKKAYYRAA